MASKRPFRLTIAESEAVVKVIYVDPKTKEYGITLGGFAGMEDIVVFNRTVAYQLAHYMREQVRSRPGLLDKDVLLDLKHAREQGRY